MRYETVKLAGQKPGKISVVLAAVHGNEQSGIFALENILPKLEIETGEVYFCYGNPKAIEQNVRFTEANLNRMFKVEDELSGADKNSYEYSRAQYLKTYLDKADALLDVHCSFTPESEPFLICEPNSESITNQLPIKTVVYGFDEVEPGGTDYYMNTNDKIGICVETGFLGDPSSVQIAEQSIYAFLKSQGHINKSPEALPNNITQNKIQMYQLYLTETNNFELKENFSDFQNIKAGDVIGKDGDQEITAPKDSIILFARNRNAVGEEAFLLGEMLNK